MDLICCLMGLLMKEIIQIVWWGILGRISISVMEIKIHHWMFHWIYLRGCSIQGVQNSQLLTMVYELRQFLIINCILSTIIWLAPTIRMKISERVRKSWTGVWWKLMIFLFWFLVKLGLDNYCIIFYLFIGLKW